MVNTFLRTSLILLIGLIAATAAQAGAFQISPLRIALSGQAPIAVITVRNESAEASVMQLELMSWSQAAGQDSYNPTRDVLATPPIFTIPAGGAQIVRVGLRRPPDSQRELAYRLFLQEVPIVAAKEGEVRVALRFGIPVFAAPVGKAPKPLLEWRIVAAPQKMLRIEALNRGNAHVQVSGVALAPAAGGAILAEHQGMDYLLPDQGRHWLVTVDQRPPPGTRLKIVARTDAGELHAEVALED